MRSGTHGDSRRLAASGSPGHGRGAVLAIVLACNAWGCASASAKLPEWGRCVPAAQARYADAGCTVRAHKVKGRLTGGYAWAPAEAFAFRPMSLAGDVKFETTAGKKIECAALGSESFAKLLSARQGRTPLWELLGCESEGRPCQSRLASGETEITNLYAWLEEPAEEGQPAPGWLLTPVIVAPSVPDPKAGWLYTVKNDERMFEPIVCRGLIGTVWLGGSRHGRDSFVSTVEPVDRMSYTYTETFSQGSPGISIPEKVPGHAPVWMEAFVEGRWERVAMTATFDFEAAEGREAIELRAKR